MPCLPLSGSDLAKDFEHAKAGTGGRRFPYLAVLVAQTTVLADQQIVNSLQVQQVTDAVALVEALGGGWDRSQLPSTRQVSEKPVKTDTIIEH